ncbi:MAG: LPS export ABC transporter periplasmic protein LptC [Bacteroidia bacterium]|nr:MAG: LPS export ABC transporter periplasmic protein LptC [Bacteroidia bacterium]
MYQANYIKKLIYTAVLLAGTALFFSCREKLEFIDTTINNYIPTQVVVDFSITYTDSAVIKLRMDAPVMKYYGRMEEPYTEFDQGLNVYFYENDSPGVPSGTLTSKFARYFESQKLWEVRDSVVAINEKGEILETELLYWDETKELIYTDKFVRIIQADQIILGTGLESDIKFSKWVIKNVSGTLSLDDE